MRRRLLLCCLLSCLLTTGAQAANMVVSSTSDSGPGTLRQAILDAAANGTATQDIISFNIPVNVFNQRIIYLASPLPALSSKITIDGTTQPGEKFAVTDAKICIMKDDYAADFTLFNISNASEIKIYGLYMVYGYQQGIFTPPFRSDFLYAISLSNAFDIEIGAPGKGNVINGYNFGIYSLSDSCRNIRIQSNYIGQGLYYSDPQFDIAPVVLPVIAGIQMINAKDVLIGGATPAEGNVIKANRAVGLNANTTDCGFIRIENNVFGKYYDRTLILGGGDVNCPACPNIFIGPNQYLGPSTNPKLDYDVSIINNEIPTSLGVDMLARPFIIKGNKFDIPAGSPLFTSTAAKLIITNCDAGMVGGASTAEANSFRQGGVTGINAIVAYENVSVGFSKNIFECNVLQGSPTVVSSMKTLIPFVRINQTTATLVSGTATPNCTIELFYDDDCAACEGELYIGSTTSDALGNWSFSGTIARPVVATATTGLGATGPFSTPQTDVSNVVITNPTCGQNNGSITGIAITSGDGYLWKDENGNIVGNSADLLNVGAGQYIFYAKLGNNCLQFGGVFELRNGGSIIADTANKIITQPSCGNNNGSIENIALYPVTNSVIEWQNERGQVIPGELNAPYVSLRNLYPGKYRLYIRDTTGAGCNDSTFFYELVNAFGPAFDTSNVKITPAGCSASNGSITNLVLRQLLNTPLTEWLDSLNRPVGSSLDLTGQPPGKYRLRFKDAGTCDTTYTPFFIITEVTDAIPIAVTHVSEKMAHCNQDNGFIQINGFDNDPAFFSFHWLMDSVTYLGIGSQLGNLSPGRYQCIATDSNGCQRQVYAATITRLPAPSFNLQQLTVRPDTCERSVGSISGLAVRDADAPQYKWFNAAAQEIGRQTSLQNIQAGDYYVEVTDAMQCTVVSPVFTVENILQQLPAPAYTNLTIPKGVSFTLEPSIPGTGTYLLYDAQTGGIALQQNNAGRFQLPGLQNDAIYFIEFQQGDCRSTRARVEVKVVDESKVVLPNAFSPNGDGLHETWGPIIFGLAKLQYLRVFNRWGQVVFETNDPNRRWDGRFKGNPLPVGTYYWVLKAVDHLGKPITDSGPVLIVR